MLVSFIGSPCSGKTTTAAMIFAALKEQGNPCEFITEQARSFIAERRFSLKLGPNESLMLTGDDQIAIMKRQLQLDTAFKWSVPKETVIVSDSSALNALLYMSDSLREDQQVKDCVRQAVGVSDLIFFAPMVQPGYGLDPNRVHSMEQSREIEKSIYPIFNQMCPEIFPKVIALRGAPQARHSQAVEAILEEMSK